MEIKAKIEYGKLKKLVEEMSKKYSVKVGLLAGKGADDLTDSGITYAHLGTIQEFGADIKITPKMAAYLAITARELGLPKLEAKGDGYIHIPARSFLRMPLTTKNRVVKELKKQLDANEEEIINYIAKNADFQTLAIMLGASAVEVVNEAFQSAGFGEWQPNSPFTIAMKGSALPLTGRGKENDAAGHLKQRITYEVKKDG